MTIFYTNLQISTLMLVFNLISRYIRIRKIAPVLFKQQARQQASFRSGYSSSSQNPYFSVIYFFLRLQNVLVLTYFQFLAKMVYPGGSESHFSFYHGKNSNSNLFSPTLLFLFCVPVYACKLLQYMQAQTTSFFMQTYTTKFKSSSGFGSA